MRHKLAKTPWVGLVLVAMLAFGQVISFPFLHWDDPSLLVDNPLVAAPFSQGPLALFRTASFGYPAPATVLGWSVEHALFGFDPMAFHTTNLLLHLVNLVLVYRLLLRLIPSTPAAALGATVFALHPIVAEPVAWATGRKDLQATLFVLAALIVLLGKRDSTELPSPRRFALASVLGLLAILSKPTAAVVPLLLVAAAHLAWPREPLRRLVAPLAPLGVAAVALVLVGNAGHQALTDARPRTVGEAVHQVLSAWALQSQHLVWPRGLLPVYYDLPGDPSTVHLGLGLALLLLLGFAAWRHRASALGLGLIVFFVAYAPVAAILPNRRWVADSYLYLPLVGVVLALAAIVERRITRPVPFAVLFSLTLVLFSLGSLVQARTYASNAALWEPVIERYPTSPAAFALYGMGLAADKRDDEAAKVFVHLAKEWPDHPGVESNQAWAFLRLGLPARARERLERGAARGDVECQRALKQLNP